MCSFETGSADGVENREKSSTATLPARMALVAGQAMNRLLSFRKGGEMVRPGSAGEATPLTESAPEVPSALLTSHTANRCVYAHSRNKSHG